MSLTDLTALTLAKSIAQGEISVREAALAALARMEEMEPSIGAFTYQNDHVLTEADALDEKKKSLSQLPPLFGVPYALKDNMSYEGLPNTAGGRLLLKEVAAEDAAVARLLKQAGCLFLGKTNMDELAMGSCTATSCHHPTYNPMDTSRSPGGSSGGPAAAVAAKEACFAVGSDTGGSIRQPAAFCGVVGLKPTYGMIDSAGVIPLAPSLDALGPMTRNIADCAAVFTVLAQKEAEEYREALSRGVRGLRIGIPKEYMSAGVVPPLQERVEAAAQALAEQGAAVFWMSLPHSEYGLAAYHVIAPVEINRVLSGIGREQDPAVRSGLLGAEVKRRLLAGAYFGQGQGYEKYYEKACRVRRLLRQEFAIAFARYDVLLAPVTRDVAFPLNAAPTDPVEMYLNDLLLAPVNLAGNVALAMPYGKAFGMPAGIQLIAAHHREELLFQVGQMLETELQNEIKF